MTTSDATRQLQRSYWTAFAATLIFFVGYYALLVPFPLYLVGLGLPDWEVGVILGAFGVASLVGRPLAGALSDRWGRRPVMLFGAASLAVGSGGVLFTTAPVLLFILRLLQALGYVAFTTSGTALVSDVTPAPRRAGALAVFGAAANVAMTLTPASISALMPLLTIPGALGVSAAMAGLGGLLATTLRAAPTSGSRLDPATLLRVPASVAQPMLATFLFGLGWGAFLQYTPLLAERRELGAAGLVYTVYGLGIITARLTTGRLLDRPSRFTILRWHGIILAVGLVVFALAASLAPLLVAAVLIAAGSGILHPGLIATFVERMPASEGGRAVAYFYLSFDLGIGLGAAVLGAVLQAFGLTALFGLAAVAVLLALPLIRQLPAARVVHTEG